MKSILKLGVTLLLCLSACCSSQVEARSSGVYIVPVKSTPEPDAVNLSIIFPQNYKNKKKLPINSRLRLEGFPLGMMSPFDRAQEIFNNPDGQTVHVFIDDHPYIALNQSSKNNFNENRRYSDKIIGFKLPFIISPGEHIIRVFPVRSYNESLKNRGCFDASVFYVQDKRRTNNSNVDLKAPYLTYNEPQGSFPVEKSNPLLLDFYITNCQLSPDGYKVKISINREEYGNLTEWTPYYIYGLTKGDHRIHMELIDKDNRSVPGLFNSIERKISIK